MKNSGIKRTIRKQRLSSKKAAKYDKVREQVDAELPQLIARRQQRVASAVGHRFTAADFPKLPGLDEVVVYGRGRAARRSSSLK